MKIKKIFPRIIDVVFNYHMEFLPCRVLPYGMTGTYDLNTEIFTPHDPEFTPRYMPPGRLFIGYPHYKSVYEVYYPDDASKN